MLQAFNAILVEEANRLDGDIYERSIHTSPWIDLVDTGAFPDGIGDLVSTMIWERTLPANQIVWVNLAGAATGNDAIIPGATGSTAALQTVATAKTLREYRLQTTALESEYLNLNDLRTAVIREEQLGAMRDNLSMNTNYLWRVRARQEYDRLVKHVTMVAAGNVESAAGGSADTTVSDSLMSNASLTRYRNRMIRMGAGRRPLDRMDGAPVFGLICDSEVSDQLKSETAITEALKFDNRANELLSPLGVERAYKNFFHIIDDCAPRYTFASSQTVQSVPVATAGSGYTGTPSVSFSGGAGTGAAAYAIMNNGGVSSIVVTANGSGYTSAPTASLTGGNPTVAATLGTVVVGGSFTEVLPYVAQSANPANGQFGTALVENTAYETAAYTRSYIYHQDVMKLLYPNSGQSGAGVKFDPVNYRGEWRWLNVQNLDPASVAYNPIGNIGKFRGDFAAATKPGVLEYGFAVTHKRPGF